MDKKKGFGLLEIIIASAIVSVTIFSLSYVFLIASKLNAVSSDTVRANFLAEEGVEALRFLRDKSWSANLSGLSVGTTYYLSFVSATSAWSLGSSGGAYIDNAFWRTITVANVGRDASFNILSSGGTNDPDTKKVNVQVAWLERGATTTITLSTYLTNIFNN